MNNAASIMSAPSQPNAETRRAVFLEITGKWGKFSEEDLAALRDNEDLVTQLADKYSLGKTQAQSDVDALLKGRQI